MTKRIRFSLVLTPISGRSSMPLSNQSNTDDWLHNESTDILQNLNSLHNHEATSDQLPNIIDKLTDSPEQRIIKVDQLVITQTERGFTLLESGAETTLKDGDMIAISSSNFMVNITSESIVEYEGPQRRYEFDTLGANHNDSWADGSTPHPTQQPNDPFSGSNYQPSMQHNTSVANAHQHDPLSFLYSGHHSQTPHDRYSHNPFDQAPEVLTTHSTMPTSSGLNIDTQGHYSPTSTHNERPQPQATAQGSPGNILRDLGINESQNSSILSGRYGHSGKTLDEKSPMDMLDEYLDEPNNTLPARTHPMQPYEGYTYQAPQPFEHEPDNRSITRSLKGAFKKLMS